MEVRQARPEEYDAVGRVTQAAWREFERPDEVWAGYYELLGDAAGRAEHATVLVALEDGEPVGTVTVELESTIDAGGGLDPGQASIRMLAVDPPWRGRGIGRRLVQASLERAQAAGKTVVTLHTADEMRAATRIYHSFGFDRDPANDFVVGPGIALRAYRLEL